MRLNELLRSEADEELELAAESTLLTVPETRSLGLGRSPSPVSLRSRLSHSPTRSSYKEAVSRRSGDKPTSSAKHRRLATFFKSNSEAAFDVDDDCEEGGRSRSNTGSPAATPVRLTAGGIDLKNVKQKAHNVKQKLTNLTKNNRRGSNASSNASQQSERSTPSRAQRSCAQKTSPLAADPNASMNSSLMDNASLASSVAPSHTSADNVSEHGLSPNVYVAGRPAAAMEQQNQSQPQQVLSQAVQYKAAVATLLAAITLVSPGFFAGFLWGVYVFVIVFTYVFVGQPLATDQLIDLRHRQNDQLMEIKQQEIQKLTGLQHKGWMNQLRGRYDAHKYHVNQTQSVVVRVHGSLLRINKFDKNVLKHTVYDDWSLNHQLRLHQQSLTIYDLTDAKVCLRPKNLARRRWWSRKYPICIQLALGAEITHKSDGFSDFTDGSSAASESDVSTKSKPKLPVDKEDPCCSTSSEEDEVESAEEADAGLNRMSRSRSADTSLVDKEKAASKKLSKEASPDTVSFDIQTPTNSPQKRYTKRKKKRAVRRKQLFLFARSTREKEQWFHKFRQASIKPLGEDALQQSADNLNLVGETLDGMSEGLQYTHAQKQFIKYMRELIPSECISTTFDREQDLSQVVTMDLGRSMLLHAAKDAAKQLTPETIATVNAVAARIFYDFCRDADWIQKIQFRIQQKLAAIHLPYYIETLQLTRLDPGRVSPRILGIRNLAMDDWGLWIDLEVTYTGCMWLTLETKLNLIKLADTAKLDSDSDLPHHHNPALNPSQSGRLHCYSDSSLPESPESSPDEAEPPSNWKPNKNKPQDPSAPRESAKKRISNLVDRVAQSNLFKKATEIKSVKRLMEGVSSTPLTLMVEVTHVEGTLAINLPAPPSDRVWYGFRHPPKLQLKGVPRIGERSVDLSALSAWIEGRLRLLMEKNLVMPNMDDLIVPLMSGNPMLSTGYNA